MKNPFYFGNEVYGDDFCNRITELKELKLDCASGQNVLLYAPRRFGKTSLLRKLEQDMNDKKEYKVLYLDLFSISSIDEFIQKYFDLIAKSFETPTSKFIDILKNILKIRANINMTLNTSGDMFYSLSVNKKEQIKTLEDVLNLPFLYAKKFDKKIIVIFDEFQEIEQLNFEKKLRSVIQTHTREVAYLFSGSKKSILTQMFNDNTRAFYKGVKHFHINEIKLNDWNIFIKSKFDKSGKIINDKHIKKIYQITKGFPYYMQEIMSVVWSKADKKVNDDILEQSLKLIIERENDLYSLMWTQLTPNQKNTLKYIISFDGLNLYANENIKESNLTATTLKSTLEALIKKDICTKKNNQYHLIDPFMKYWLDVIL